VIDEQSKVSRHARKSSGSFWKELPILLGVALLVAFLVRAFVVQTFYIPSPSMEHTLNIDDRVLVNKLVYDFRSPHRGEIIVFESPLSWRSNPDEKDFIKRVIAVGGDHVTCCDAQGRIMVNGKPLDEGYIFSEDGVQDPAATEPFDITVPAGRLWVMGDHRSASGDSLANYRKNKADMNAATIAEDKVVGRAFVLFWPFSRATWLTVPDTFDTVPAPTGS
jgi:signal peptidase I